MMAADRISPEQQAEISAEQTQLLYANLPLSLAVTAVIAGILAFAMSGHVSAPFELGWLALLLAVCGARLGLWLSWRRDLGRIGPARWQGLFELGAFASGAAWGSAVALVYPVDSIAHQVFMGFVLASMAAGAVSTLALHFKSYVLFLLPALMPYTIRLFVEGGELQLFMGCIFALGQMFLLVNARRFDAVTINALTLARENQRLVDALKSALRAAEDASSAKTQFLANMSHEIRTPLGGVLGMSELLLKTSLGQQQRRLAATMNQSAGALLSLVGDVLDLSRIESGKLSLDSQAFALRTPIEEAIELVAGAAYRKGLEVHLITGTALPTCVVGDPSRLRQVLVNLIGNAVKFSDAGQVTVRVAATAAGSGYAIEMSISDTGYGIPPRDMEQLFSPFSRDEAEAKRRIGGSGLGLAITRHLVRLMGGEVSLGSELGKGTTVSFRLSLDAADGGEGAVEEEPAILAGQRVLVVDDRILSREAIASRIRCATARIDLACSEEEALAKLKRAAGESDPYRLVLVDRVRARSDNLAFHRRIRSTPDFTATRVVAFMPISMTIDAALEQELGECAFVSKPVRRADLLNMIGVALRNSMTAKSTVEAERQQAPLDRSATPEPVALPEVGHQAEASLGGLKVLLAEDNPVNQEVALAYLAGFGCTAELACNGQEAIEAHAQSSYDMVLMDCQMPQLDGLTAIRHIRQWERTQGSTRIPIVMVTANAFASDREQAFEAGADDFLSKPYSEAQLRRIMQKNAARAAA